MQLTRTPLLQTEMHWIGCWWWQMATSANRHFWQNCVRRTNKDLSFFFVEKPATTRQDWLGQSEPVSDIVLPLFSCPVNQKSLTHKWVALASHGNKRPFEAAWRPQLWLLSICNANVGAFEQPLSHNMFINDNIWQGNPMSTSNTSATKNCTMCAKERTTLPKNLRSNSQLLVVAEEMINKSANQLTFSWSARGKSMHNAPTVWHENCPTPIVCSHMKAQQKKLIQWTLFSMKPKCGKKIMAHLSKWTNQITQNIRWQWDFVRNIWCPNLKMSKQNHDVIDDTLEQTNWPHLLRLCDAHCWQKENSNVAQTDFVVVRQIHLISMKDNFVLVVHKKNCFVKDHGLCMVQRRCMHC